MIHKDFGDIWYRIIVNNTQKNFISKEKYEDRYNEDLEKTHMKKQN